MLMVGLLEHSETSPDELNYSIDLGLYDLIKNEQYQDLAQPFYRGREF